MCQSGFIPGHSTVTQMVEMYHSFNKAVSEGKEIRVGIILSQNLSWNKHICFVKERARSAITRLSQFRHTLERKYI
jgi:outer membrane receptor for ferrienterochelin and colicin